MGYKIKQLATIDGNAYAVLEMDVSATFEREQEGVTGVWGSLINTGV